MAKEGLLLSSVALEDIQWIVPKKTLLKLGLMLPCSSSSVPFSWNLPSVCEGKTYPVRMNNFMTIHRFSVFIVSRRISQCEKSQWACLFCPMVIHIGASIGSFPTCAPVALLWRYTWCVGQVLAPKTWTKSNKGGLEQSFSCVRFLNTNAEGAQSMTIAYRNEDDGHR